MEEGKKGSRSYLGSNCRCPGEKSVTVIERDQSSGEVEITRGVEMGRTLMGWI